MTFGFYQKNWFTPILRVFFIFTNNYYRASSNPSETIENPVSCKRVDIFQLIRGNLKHKETINYNK